ncbi:MAG: FHA domain-containing protein [Deltaproteobacteria bacterium]|nr:FHA domain-containing protein [Deltaproteobacteria bacterium]
MNDNTPEQSGMPLEDFYEDGKKLSVVKFQERHGEAFLLHRSDGGSLRPPQGPQRTVAADGSQLPGNPGGGMKTSYVVFPVKQTGRSMFAQLISVGRTKNNDVIISDVSISKFHAFFKKGENGKFFVQDAGSRNGTFVNGKKVPESGKGDPVLIQPGAKIRFGAVELTFQEAAELHDLVSWIARGGR